MFQDASSVYSPDDSQGVTAGNPPFKVPTFGLPTATHKNMIIGALVILAVLYLVHRYRKGEALMEKDVLAIVAALVATVVVFTLLTGGSLNLGTSKSGPQFSLGYTGPQYG